MKKIFIILLLFILAMIIHGERLAVLSQLTRPTAVCVDQNQVIITQEKEIFVYSLNPFKLITRFGKQGEGPGEFKWNPHVSIHQGSLFINDMGKVMVFDRTGIFRKQFKLPFMYFYIYYPILGAGNNFVAFKLENMKEKKTFEFIGKVFTPDFKLIKEFYNAGSPQLLPPPPLGSKRKKVNLEVIFDLVDYGVTASRIVVVDSRKGFYIALFDFTGNKKLEIKKDYEKIRVSPKFEQNYMKELRQSKRWQQLKANFNYKFKSHFPAFSSFKTRQDKIYLTSYKKMNGKFEVVVLDLRGNILKRAFVMPRSQQGSINEQHRPLSSTYDICRDKLYFLKDNEEEEVWELHVENIN